MIQLTRGCALKVGFVDVTVLAHASITNKEKHELNLRTRCNSHIISKIKNMTWNLLPYTKSKYKNLTLISSNAHAARIYAKIENKFSLPC